MKRNELIQLRELVKKETERRERIKDLLKNDLVNEYLRLTNTSPTDLDPDNIIDIINKVLSTFIISKTNNIYVCTSAWYITVRIFYQDDEYESIYVPIDSNQAEFKVYTDIESEKTILAVRDENESHGRPLISDIEKEKNILNPYNENRNRNGFSEVKNDFFEHALKDGQTKTKRLLLSKYPRL